MTVRFEIDAEDLAKAARHRKVEVADAEADAIAAAGQAAAGLGMRWSKRVELAASAQDVLLASMFGFAKPAAVSLIFGRTPQEVLE